jgi:ArsR family transcriptional regulator
MLTPDKLFALLADKTRLRCLALLSYSKELCVCQLTNVLEESQPKISRHLASLRQSGILADERRGIWIYYQIDSQLNDWAKNVLENVLASIVTQEPYCSDRGKLQNLNINGICQGSLASFA